MSPLNRRELNLLKEKFGNGSGFDEAVKRAEGGEPLAYVLGEWYFYGLTFRLNSKCLIPRPDTEHIAEAAINLIPENGFFADICTGSGCIAISVLKNRTDLKAAALDISEKALEAAKENAGLNQIPCGTIKVGARLEFIQKDIFDLNSGRELTDRFCKEKEVCGGIFDAIVSNPPYIRTDILPTLETVRSEPVEALDGGRDGLMFYRHIIKEFLRCLKPDGIFIFEIGYDQGREIITIASDNGLDCRITKDYGGNDRVAVMRRKTLA